MFVTLLFACLCKIARRETLRNDMLCVVLLQGLDIFSCRGIKTNEGFSEALFLMMCPLSNRTLGATDAVRSHASLTNLVHNRQDIFSMQLTRLGFPKLPMSLVEKAPDTVAPTLAIVSLGSRLKKIVVTRKTQKLRGQKSRKCRC